MRHHWHRAAARLFGAASALRDAIGAPQSPAVRAHHRATLAALRATLGEAAFERAWAAGASRPLEDAIAEAMHLAAAPVPPSPSPPPPAAAAARRSSQPELTRRELEVLRLLAERRADREIATALAISPRTVTTHVTNILAKLGLPTRTAAAAYALRHRLI